MNPSAIHRLSPLTVAVAALLAHCLPASAQNASDTATTLPSVGVTATLKRSPKASITGLGDQPAWETPAQAQTFSQDAIKDAQVTRLADITKLDASTTDSYNTVGYWDYLSIRGFTLDNAYNYRREGLPINAETRISLDNKSAVELFKGTSGIQSGVSSPGGLVNFVVKRPQGRVRTAELALSDVGNVLTSLDFGDRLGEQNQFGLHVNAALERLNTKTDNTHGHRQLFAAAGDWQVAPGTLIEAEFEHSWQSQPSVPGLSVLGSTLPSARDFNPNININNQDWTLPVQLQGDTGTLRWRQSLGDSWKSTVTYGEQHLKSNDRAAFPFGCSTASVYTNYCGDGSHDLYDYRSDNELRITRSLLAQLQGKVQTGALQHELSVSMLSSLFHTEITTQAYNWVGYGSVHNPSGPQPADPSLLTASTNRQERSTEFALQDTVRLNTDWQAWAGLRHTSLSRHSVKTDGTEDTAINQSFNTPWAALAYTFAPLTRAYVSWGEGTENRVAPTATGLANSGQILPAHKSRQLELGVKGQYTADHLHAQWGMNWFSIVRPEAVDVNNTFAYDGQSRHAGVEGYWQGRIGMWGLSGSAMLLDAKRQNSRQDGVNGRRPTNVPGNTLKVSGSYTFASAVPVTVQTDVVREGQRWVDTSNTISLPAWTRVDLSLRANQVLQGQTITWRLGIINLLDARDWRESPSLAGHIYLFPQPKRTATLSAQLNF
ncbi:MAG: TonB-dependent receptor plug domain-containing protein [Aquabacterium sp.]|nr:TonB-dependent receptor plug domain-containing protein [Aquabacterium sp.]